MKPARSFHPALPGVAALLISLSGATATASYVAHYPFVRPVLTIPAQEELAALTLDSTIWAVSPGTPPDIRIADETARPIPHLLRKAGEQRMRTVRDNCRTTVSALQELPDNRLALTVTLDNKAPFATGIEFTTPLKDFERQITVHGIGESETPEMLVENALIYDYTRFADLRSSSIALPPNRYRRFSIAIGNVTDEQQSPQRQISRTLEQGVDVRLIDQTTLTARPFRMDAVQLYAERQTESHTVERDRPIPLKSWAVRQVPRLRQTVIELETHNEPVTGFTLQVADRNFTRRISVEVPADNGSGDAWRAIGSATISRIAFRNLLHEERRVSFAERRSPRFRLVIENHDHPPLDISGAEAFGPVWQALVIATPGQQGQLYYGAATPQPPRYNTAAIQRVIEGGFEPVAFALGAPVDNPHYRQPGRTLTGVIGSRTFFTGTVVIMIAVMATALARAARRIS